MKIESVGGLPPFSFHYHPQGNSREKFVQKRVQGKKETRLQAKHVK